MSETYSRVYSLDNVNVVSSYTVSSGSASTPSIVTENAALKVTSIPDGATVDSVVLTATVYLYLANWARIATINGETITPGGSGRTADLSSLVTGNGEYQIPFRFQAAPVMTADGSYTDAMMCTSMAVTITYSVTEPEPEPPTPPAPVINTPSAANRICIFEPDAQDWNTNGIITLRPTSCEVEEVAGGKFELKMVHPLSGDRRWKDIKPEYLVRAPVPAKRLTAIEGIHQDSPWEDGAQLWQANASVNVYSKPVISYAITYDTWVPYRSYAAGDKVTYNGNNYRCISAHGGLSTFQSNLWTRIANYSSGGGSILTTLRNGDQFICLNAYNSSWLYMRTLDGSIYGYVQTSSATKIRDLDSSDVDIGGVEERVIRAQMFRIYKVEIKHEAGTIEIWARHISYDFERNTLGACDLYQTTTAGCIASIQANLMVPDTRTMATNIYDPLGSEGVTVDWSWKNPISALLDPDTGLVALRKGQCIRDNNDIFILANDPADRGYRISYGVNMTGITWTEDVDDVITRVIPVGQDENGDPLLLDGTEPWVDSSHILDYAIIRCSVLKVKDAKVSTDMTTEQARAKMAQEAQKQFDEEHVDVEKLKLKVQFVKLGDTVQYAQYRALENLSLYDLVTITDAPLGIEVKAQMVAYKWNAILQRYIEITLGDPFDYATRGSVPAYELSAGAVTFTKLSADAIRQIKEEVS